MKNLITTVILVAFSLTLNAQKIIEKTIDYKNQDINIDLDFATTIEIKTWDKPSIYVKADLTTEDGKYLELYALNISERHSKIDIKSDALPMFAAYQKDFEINHPNSGSNYNKVGLEHKINYTLFLPKNSKVKLSSISGNLNAETIEGDFTADLISGNINIKNYKGNLDLTTISGEIDLKMINTSLTAKTIQGNIYADEKLKFTATNEFVGQKIAGKTANANSKLKLNTISGNMYLRY